MSTTYDFPSAEANTLEYARRQDAEDPIRHMREHFILPTRTSMKKKALDGKLPGYPPNSAAPGTSPQTTSPTDASDSTTPAVYFCGNSLGLQPKATRTFLDAQLETWASIGVHGHFTPLSNSPHKTWQDMAADCAARSAAIVGANPEEIAIMNTLTANLHFLMASFYKPTEKRHKIISEWKPFPSDTYAIATQIQWHGLDPSTSLIELHPDDNYYISTSSILATIEEHAETTALLLLPGIQYWSGQLFDIPTITSFAQSRGIIVGWDLAHAAGNVPLKLHDWGVDFAAWCTYKYMNAGPGAIAGAFVHERHGKVDGEKFTHRLAGWYGNDKSTRFEMAKEFRPTPGAGGWVVSNPSAIDLASLGAALSVFDQTSIEQLRSKSLRLTAYAAFLLNQILAEDSAAFRIITPANKEERGAQLSVLLREGLLDVVGEKMEEAGVVCDRRKPDVMRVAPVPMYNTYEDVWRCVGALRRAIFD